MSEYILEENNMLREKAESLNEKLQAAEEREANLKDKNERYEKALRDIQEHIELSLGETGAKMSTVWNICEWALSNKKQTPPPCPDCDHHYPECEC